MMMKNGPLRVVLLSMVTYLNVLLLQWASLHIKSPRTFKKNDQEFKLKLMLMHKGKYIF